MLVFVKYEILIAFSFLFLTHLNSNCQNFLDTEWQSVPLDTMHWLVKDHDITFSNNEAVVKNNIFLKHTKLSEFIAEFEVKDASWPSFSFHAQNADMHEEVYFRVFASNSIYAIQYVPIYKGFTPWRLYGSKQGKCVYNKEWNKIRIEVIKNQLKVSVNETFIPNLSLDFISEKSETGTLGIGALYGSARFRNFRYKKINDESFSSAAKKDSDLISDYEISPAFPLIKSSNETLGIGLEKFSYPQNDLLKAIAWEKVSTDNNGILNITKFRNNKDSIGNANYIIIRKQLNFY